MKDLTNAQFNGLKTLSNNPLIERSTIDLLGNGLLNITIVSTVGAKLDNVNFLIECIFPGKTYRVTPGQSVEDGVFSENYSIDFEGETLINLMMRKSPEPLKKWSLEDVMRREG